MPGLDGLCLAAIVQEKYPGTKIQLTSGFNDSQHASEAAEDLRTMMLKKPCSAPKLLDAIRALLDQ